MAPSPRGGARKYGGGGRRNTLLPRLMLLAAVLVVALKAGPAFAWVSARGAVSLGSRRKGSTYVDDWKRLRDALNSRSKPRESTIAAPPPTKEALALAEPRIMSPEVLAQLAVSLRNRRRFANCSVVGNDSSMRNAALGGEIDGANAVYRMNFAPLRNYKVDTGARTHTQCVNPEKMRLQLRENKVRGGGGRGAAVAHAR